MTTSTFSFYYETDNIGAFRPISNICTVDVQIHLDHFHDKSRLKEKNVHWNFCKKKKNTQSVYEKPERLQNRLLLFNVVFYIQTKNLYIKTHHLLSQGRQ